jgi:integrase
LKGPAGRWSVKGRRGISFRLNAQLHRTYFVYHAGSYEFGGFTVEEALVRQGELRKPKTLGQKPVKRSTHTFREVCAKWFEWAQARPSGAKYRVGPSTAKDYERHIAFLNERFGDRKIGAVGVEDIERLIQELQARRGPNGKRLSESTIANYLNPLAGTLRYATRTHSPRLLTANPMLSVGDGVKVSSSQTREHREWSEAEIQAVIDAARANDAKKEQRQSYALAIELLLRSGLRLGECLGLQFCCINFDAGVLVIHQSWGKDNQLGPVKTKSSNRRVKISKELLSRLATLSLEREPEDFIFATRKGESPISQTNFRRRGWYPAIKAAGITGGPRVTPHDARHGFASWAASRGISSSDLKEHLGHATEATTEGIYVHAFGREHEDRIAAVLDGAVMPA